MAVPQRRAYDDTQIAIVCHEMIRGLQLAVSDPCPSDPWLAAGPAVRQRTVHGVQRIIAGAGPVENHRGWVKEMTSDGWRRGERKDRQERTHPNLVDWFDLPAPERLKDELFWLITGRMMSELTS
jgi:hypothetical protein